MNERLRRHIDTLFAGAPQTEQTLELKEEMLRNLLDKYNDLLNEGKSAEEAYRIAVAGIGDVSELLGQTSAGVRQTDVNEARRERPSVVAGPLWLAAVCVYLLLSFRTHAWGLTWLVFPITASVGMVIHGVSDLSKLGGKDE